MKNEVLMPINQDFLDVFDIFMDEEQKTKIRANNVRQYAEGIVDLLLKDKIKATLKPNEIYEGINWGRKIKILKENYDEVIANDIQEIFKIGGDGSHFNGKVKEEELHLIIEKAIHIVENIFVKYFLTPEHKFGSENIYTIFSMLPLKHRIYILEKVSGKYVNQDVVDRLSLAYVKFGEKDKAYKLLEKALRDEVINSQFFEYKKKALGVLDSNLIELYRKNEGYEKNPKYSKALVANDLLVVGLPTSKDVFDTAKAVQIFSEWFKQDKDKYPEFINLFLYLMKTDTRQYE
ncbi:MAG: hypothetical protein ACLS3Q_12035 [Lachnospira sp.]|jgi:tetratricopeptide (TPR) repeat protein